MDLEARRTPRLTLRRPVSDDLGWLVGVHSDPANYEHAPDGANSPAEAARLARRAVDVPDGCCWIVCESDDAVGVVGIDRMTFGGRPSWNLHYRFVPGARGRGLASEACDEVLAVAASVDPSRSVVVRTRPANEPARRLAERLGLVRRPELDEGNGLIAYVQPLT